MFSFFKKKKKEILETKNDENNFENTSDINCEKEIAEQILKELEQETLTDFIEIKIDSYKKPNLTNSKFGGLPYLPKTNKIPTDKEGNQLLFLAQIKCEELPENNIYPKTGILQFWIFNDDLMGLDFDNHTSDDSKRVIYYPTIENHYNESELQEIYNPINDEDELFTPIENNETYGLEFLVKKEGIKVTDYRFETMFIKKWNERFPDNQISSIFGIDNHEICEMIYHNYTDEHKIGGYAFFTQNDPREYENSEYEILLLQITTDFDNNTKKYRIIWGDCGVGAFFIKPEKLAELDFSNALYNWDCG